MGGGLGGQEFTISLWIRLDAAGLAAGGSPEPQTLLSYRVPAPLDSSGGAHAANGETEVALLLDRTAGAELCLVLRDEVLWSLRHSLAGADATARPSLPAAAFCADVVLWGEQKCSG